MTVWLWANMYNIRTLKLKQFQPSFIAMTLLSPAGISTKWKNITVLMEESSLLFQHLAVWRLTKTTRQKNPELFSKKVEHCSTLPKCKVILPYYEWRCHSRQNTFNMLVYCIVYLWNKEKGEKVYLNHHTVLETPPWAFAFWSGFKLTDVLFKLHLLTGACSNKSIIIFNGLLLLVWIYKFEARMHDISLCIYNVVVAPSKLLPVLGWMVSFKLLGSICS